MFGDTSRPPKADSPKQGDVPLSAALASLGVLLAIVFSTPQGSAKLSRIYFEHFEAVYLAGYGAICLVAALFLWGIVRNTRALSARMRLLRPVSYPDSGVLAGKSVDGMTLYVPQAARLGHVQILGATGRGKTESVILPWLVRDLQGGHSTILIDGKGDPDLALKIQCAASELGAQVRVFDLGNPTASCITNPLANGTPQQLTDRLFTALTFQDPFYKAVQYDICRSLIELIQEVDAQAGKPGVVTFRRLYELLTSEDALAEAVCRSRRRSLQDRLGAHLAEMPKTREQNLKGLTSQLGPFAVGEVAVLVNGDVGSTAEGALSISELVLAEGSDVPVALVVLLPTLKYQEIGRQLGKLFLQELGWAVGERASASVRKAPFVSVYLDEFSAFVYDGFHQILNKARSSHVALHLSHQSIGDLAIVSTDFATVVNTNTNVKCLFGLNDPETADFFARHLGTSTEEKLTERAERRPLWGGAERTGDVSIRNVEAYKVHPNQLKNFTHGRGVLHMPSRLGNITAEIQFAGLSSADLVRKEVR